MEARGKYLAQNTNYASQPGDPDGYQHAVRRTEIGRAVENSGKEGDAAENPGNGAGQIISAIINTVPVQSKSTAFRSGMS